MGAGAPGCLIRSWGGTPPIAVERSPSSEGGQAHAAWARTVVSAAARADRVGDLPIVVRKETGYGLGRSGWISVTLDERLDASSWRETEEWVRTSYALGAPNALGHLVIEGDDPVRADSAASERSARGTMSRFPLGTRARRPRRASDTNRRPR
jgi:hypothetical protein